ncbi:MAG: hypothetical protein ACOX3T_05115 [Bdellovibrionota bacterium]
MVANRNDDRNNRNNRNDDRKSRRQSGSRRRGAKGGSENDRKRTPRDNTSLESFSENLREMLRNLTEKEIANLERAIVLAKAMQGGNNFAKPQETISVLSQNNLVKKRKESADIETKLINLLVGTMQNLTKDDIVENFIKSLHLCSKKPENWDVECRNVSFKLREMYLGIISVIASEDKTPLYAYAEHRDNYATAQFEDFEREDLSQINEAGNLVRQKIICNLLYTQKSFNDFEIVKNYQLFLKRITEKIVSVVNKHIEGRIDQENLHNIIKAVYIFARGLCIPPYLRSTVEKFQYKGEVSKLIAARELANFPDTLTFNVLYELLKPDLKENLNQFKENCNKFFRENYKIYTLPREPENADTIISGMIVFFKNLRDEMENFIAYLENIASYPYILNELEHIDSKLSKERCLKTTKKNRDKRLDIKGEIMLTVTDRDGKVFGLYYDGRRQRKGIWVKNPNNTFLLDTIDAKSLSYKAILKENASGIFIDETDNIWTSEIEQYVIKSGDTKDNLVNITRCLLEKGRNFLSLIENKYDVVFKDIQDLSIVMLALDLSKEVWGIRSDKAYWLRAEACFTHPDNFQDEEERSCVLEKFKDFYDCPENKSLTFEDSINELLPDRKFYKDNSDKDIVVDKSKAESNNSEEMSSYMEKIENYFKKGGGALKKNISVGDLKEFLKPLGVDYDPGSGKGSHSALVRGNYKYHLSQVMRKEGVYFNKLAEIIKSLGLSYKEVYEKCCVEKEDKS